MERYSEVSGKAPYSRSYVITLIHSSDKTEKLLYFKNNCQFSGFVCEENDEQEILVLNGQENLVIKLTT